MSITRPVGEQLTFKSAKTGDHILDTYLEAVERGTRTLADIVDELVNSSGDLRTDIFQFRETPIVNNVRTGVLQARVGTFVDANAGWTNISSANFATFVTDCQTAQAAAETAETNSETARDLAQDWAEKTDGVVTGSSYSAKHWATTGTVATVSAAITNVNTVAGIEADVTTVAGKSTQITRLGTSDAVADMNTLGTADIVADMNTLANIASNVTTVAGKSAQITLLGTSDAVADMNTLGTADVVADMNTLGTADVVSDMNTLGTADVVADMNTLATSSIVSDMNTLAAISSNVTTVAGISTNITTNANNIAAIQGASAAASAAALSATNASSTLSNAIVRDAATGAASMPTGTTAQRPSGAVGMFRHNSTLDKFEGYNDGAWGELGGGGPSLGTDSIVRVNSTTISENIVIPSTSNGFSAGPITIANGNTVTVNGTWSII